MTDETENPEVFLRDGEAWIPDGNALCKKIGAVYLYYADGELWAGVPGIGDDLVRDLLARKPDHDRPVLASVQTIK